MTDYYDWEKTLSFDADVTMVIGARGVGKTFGLRMQFVRDWRNHGWRFCEVCRYKNELSGVSGGYFDRISRMPEFEGYVFRTDAQHAYIAERPEDPKEKPTWQLCGYFVALSDGQRLKKRTFDNVRRILLDEAVLERADRYHNYLPNEFGVLANLVDTVSRERADTQGVRPRVYLLGNACDLANPYFAAYGVGTDLRFGYRWYAGKTFLLHYVAPGTYAHDKAARTVAGRMMANTEAGKVALGNEFVRQNREFVLPKPKRARFMFGIVCNGVSYGIWLDEREGHYHVTDSIPNNTGRPIYSLTRSDASINYVAATRLAPLMRYVMEMYAYGILRYENETIMMEFGDVLQMFGIR